MPFTETCRMEERVRMLAEYDTGNWSVSELCRRYGVCRDTFYEWRSRRDSGAADWFLDRSHAPLHCPHRTNEALKEEIIAMRRRFPYLGPRKLLAKLMRHAPEIAWPAASTIGDILKQVGLIAPVKRRRRPIDQRRPFAAVTAANDEWSADFKGWFRTGDQGVMDADGYIRLTGRLKEIINRGGEKISPREVDEVLLDHPAVAQVVTFAVPHAKLGEDVAACIVLADGATADELSIRAFAAQRLADFKVPRTVVFVAEIPQGATGKPQRSGLAQKLGLA